MENFQERQIPRDDKWRDISNIHREESACKVLQEKKCKTFDTKRNGRNGHRDTEDKWRISSLNWDTHFFFNFLHLLHMQRGRCSQLMLNQSKFFCSSSFEMLREICQHLLQQRKLFSKKKMAVREVDCGNRAYLGMARSLDRWVFTHLGNSNHKLPQVTPAFTEKNR